MNGCGHIKFPNKIAGNFLATQIGWGNLLLGKFLHCYVNYPGSWNFFDAIMLGPHLCRLPLQVLI